MIVSTSSTPIENLDIEGIAECEAQAHAGGLLGHDSGPARFVVDVRCPECGWGSFALLCAGRVAKVVWSECTMKCPGCGVKDVPWGDFWRSIEAI